MRLGFSVPLYETTLIKKEGTEGHIRVQFQALNDQFRLKLWPNERLLSPEIMSIVRNGNGSKLHVGRLPVASDCHYVGEVQSHNGAPAALSGCNHLVINLAFILFYVFLIISFSS